MSRAWRTFFHDTLSADKLHTCPTPARARGVNAELCLYTEVGRRYLDERFTFIAMMLGPIPIEDQGRILRFNELLRVAFDAEFTYEEARMWQGEYMQWCKEQATIIEARHGDHGTI